MRSRSALTNPYSQDGLACTISVDDTSEERHGGTYTFDRVFDTNATQETVFEYAAKPVVEEVFNGFYATVFVYGQTGAGKTFTMEGSHNDEELKGITPRSVDYIFDRIATTSDAYEYTVACSFVEIYMERIRDLLDRKGQANNLDIRTDLQRGVFVEGATELVVNDDKEVMRCLALGSKARQSATTAMNAMSSRSHAIFMLTIHQKDRKDLTVKTGKLFLVDLAGSEMVAKTGAQGARLEEAKTINKSLSALGNVIKALTDGKSSHVPYRDSKLTRLLSDSLGGGARTSLIIACSPSSYNAPETVSTLRFGHRAKEIKNKLRKHVGYGGTDMDEVLLKREQEIEKLQGQLHAMELESRRERRDAGRYRAIFGPLPPLEDDEWEATPACDMQEQVRAALARSDAGSRELEAIHRERIKLGHAIEATERHLASEKSLFSQLRTDVGKALRRAFGLGAAAGGGVGDGARMGGGKENDANGAAATTDESQELAATIKTLDEALSMAKWKAETALKSLRPVREAAAAVAAAAKHTASMLIPNPGEVPAWLTDGSWTAHPGGAGKKGAAGGGGRGGKQGGGGGGASNPGIGKASRGGPAKNTIWPVKPPQLASTLGIGRVEMHNIPPKPPPPTAA